MNGRYMMLLKKPFATGGTARKELTLLARTMNLKPPLRLVLGRIMSPESCQCTRRKTNPEARSNAKLSRRVAVGSNAGLERGGAVDDEDEKNPAPDASAIFKP